MKEKKKGDLILPLIVFFLIFSPMIFYSFMDLTHDVPSSPIGRRIKPLFEENQRKLDGQRHYGLWIALLCR